MRYSDRGGLSWKARVDREAVRFQAAGMFAEGMAPSRVAEVLSVTPKSARQWYRRWKDGGEQALASAGPGGALCRLDEEQTARLQAELAAGPAAHGWCEDRRWTLARVAEVIRGRFGVDYTPQGVSVLLHRLGWSPQRPARRAAERDEDAVRTWVSRRWPEVKRPRRPGVPGSVSKTRPGRV